jgi:hypothetical protein
LEAVVEPMIELALFLYACRARTRRFRNGPQPWDVADGNQLGERTGREAPHLAIVRLSIKRRNGEDRRVSDCLEAAASGPSAFGLLHGKADADLG